MSNLRGAWAALALALVACAAEPDVGQETGSLAQARVLARRAGWSALDAQVSSIDAESLRATGALPVRFGSHAGEPMILGDEELALRMVDASDAAGALEDGVLVFRGAHDATDALVAHDGAKLEVFYLVSGADAPRAWRWRMERRELGAVLEGDAVLLADASGRARYRIHAPGAVDANGARLAVTTALEGDDIVFTLEDRADAALPILVDPIVETTDWTRRLDFGSPPPWHVVPGSAVIYDDARRQLVAFGGRPWYGGTGRTNDLWTWDGTSWTQLAQSLPWPAPRLDGTFVYDPARSRGVLYGGDYDYDYGTWEWDGSRWWTVDTSASQPAARRSIAAAYDPGSRRVMFFGGVTSSSTVLAETWFYDGASWTNAMPSRSPPARTAASLGCLPTECVLFGGYDASGTPLGDTWVWNGTTWSSVTASGGPPARAGAAIARDPVRDRLVLYGGSSASATLDDAWEWTGSGWAPLSPAAPRGLNMASPAMVYDSRAGALLVTGRGGYGVEPERWWFDGTAWTSIAQVPPAPYSRAVYDESRRRTLILGSVAGTFEWDGATLTRRMLDPQPALGWPRLAYDARRAVTLAIGVNASDAVETWTLDASGWTQRTTPSELGPRVVEASAITYDRGRERVVLLGGTPWTDASAPMQTWEWDGASWSRVTPMASPTVRDLHELAYDESRGYVLLYGGQSPAWARLCDTWVYDGARWTQLAPGTSPQGCDGHALAYDTARAGVVHYGGLGERGYYGGASSLSDVHLFGGSSWSLVGVDTPGPSRTRAAMAYDRDRGRLVLWGGAQAALYSSTPMLELWELWRSRTRGSDCSDATECGSGFCVDGVCCESACGGGAIDDCQACSTRFGGLVDGTCGALADTFAPSVVCRAAVSECDEAEVCAAASTECPADAARPEGSACGAPPALPCDAQDACEGTLGASATCAARFVSAGTECSVASCVDGAETVASACTGDSAACDGASPRPCAPYVCGATSCRTSCASGADCDPSSQCVGGACVGRLALGDACVADGQCSSGACVDGYCCGSRCEGQCEACDSAGSEGTCVPIAGAPHGAREACAGDGSVCAGACDGAERASCSFAASGSSCGAARCDGASAREASSCDGAGACVAGATIDCAPFACAGGACRRSCTDDAACAPGARCQGGGCVTTSAVDAGFADAGVDGGADASSDASVQADAGPPPEAGGCGCRVASARSPVRALVIFGALALMLARRRRSR